MGTTGGSGLLTPSRARCASSPTPTPTIGPGPRCGWLRCWNGSVRTSPRLVMGSNPAMLEFLAGHRVELDVVVVAPAVNKYDIAEMWTHHREFARLRPDIVQFSLVGMPGHSLYVVATAVASCGVNVIAVEHQPFPPWSKSAARAAALGREASRRGHCSERRDGVHRGEVRGSPTALRAHDLQRRGGRRRPPGAEVCGRPADRRRGPPPPFEGHRRAPACHGAGPGWRPSLAVVGRGDGPGRSRSAGQRARRGRSCAHAGLAGPAPGPHRDLRRPRGSVVCRAVRSRHRRGDARRAPGGGEQRRRHPGGRRRRRDRLPRAARRRRRPGRRVAAPARRSGAARPHGSGRRTSLRGELHTRSHGRGRTSRSIRRS